MLSMVAVILLILAAGAYSLFRTLPTRPGINEVSNPDGIVNLSFTPNPLSVEPDSEHDLTLNLDTGGELATGVSVVIDYDPSLLTVLSVTRGDFFTNSLSDATIENGQIKFTYVVAPDSGGIEGSGTVALVRIKSSSVDSRLSFSSQTMATVISRQTNALKTASDAVITVVAVEPSTEPSTKPSSEPSAEPSTSAAPTYGKATLRVASDPTCTNLALAWDKVANAPGYYLDLSETHNFTNYKSSPRLSSDKSSYTFIGLKHNTQYYARITLASIPNFPQHSAILEVRTKDCSSTNPEDTNSSTTTPSPSPSPTPSPTPAPTKKPNVLSNLISNFTKSSTSKTSPSPSPSVSPQPSPSTLSGSLNDIFGESPQALNEPAKSNLNFFQKVILGWKAILQDIFGISLK